MVTIRVHLSQEDMKASGECTITVLAVTSTAVINITLSDHLRFLGLLRVSDRLDHLSEDAA